MVKVNNKNTRSTSLTLFWCLFFNFEHIWFLFLAFLLFTLNKLGAVFNLVNKLLEVKLTFKIARYSAKLSPKT